MRVRFQPPTARPSSMDDVFRAIADPTRRAILDELVDHDGQSLFELCARLTMTTAMRINLTSVMVDDQAKSLRFYTEVLGFRRGDRERFSEHPSNAPRRDPRSSRGNTTSIRFSRDSPSCLPTSIATSRTAPIYSIG